MSTAASQAADVDTSIRPCANASNTPGLRGQISDRTRGTSAGWKRYRPQLSPGHVLWICEPLTPLAFNAYAGPDHPLLIPDQTERFHNDVANEDRSA